MDPSFGLMLWTILILGGWLAAVIGFRKGNRMLALVAILIPVLGYVAAVMPARHSRATSHPWRRLLSPESGTAASASKRK